MEFSWPTEYIEYKKQVIAFARQELNDQVIARDAQGIFSHELWQKCADFGIQGLAAPAQYGGQLEEVDFLRAVLAMEGLGYGCEDTGLVLGLNASMWTVQMPIYHFGTQQQKEKFIPRMAKGQWIGAHALTEEQAGSDVFNVGTTAEKVEGGYLLNGTKRLVTFAPIADVAMVFANVKPELGKWGITAFLVEKTLPGFKASPVREKLGLRTVPIGEITLENCLVPEENRLGPEGSGFGMVNFSLENDRCCIMAGKLGAMERQLENTIAFARSRKQSGQPIGKFQSVSNRIAEMKLRLETSRLLLYKVAWLKSQGKQAMLEASLLKLHLSESFVASSMDAIRCHGGNGYLSEYGIDRDLRDAIGGVIYAGTSDIQRNIIAGMLGL